MKTRALTTAVLVILTVLLFPFGTYDSVTVRTSADAPTDAYIFAEEGAVSVSASAAVLMDADSGRVLFAKQPDKVLPMASTTKIMTAVLILEMLPPQSVVTVTRESVGIEGSSVYLAEGEKLTVEELLYCMMLRSGNDSATALAIACAGSEERFVRMMNAKAFELGLLSTSFMNPSGLPAEGHHTTAYELAKLTAYALKNDAFTEITSTVRITAANRYLVNRNRLLPTYAGMLGVKTGYTPEAGKCLVTAATRDGVTLVAVTLCDGNEWNDHKAMLDYGFVRLEAVTVLEKGAAVTVIPVTGEGLVTASNQSALTCAVPAGTGIDVVIEAPETLGAPVYIGDTVAEAVVYADGKPVARIPLTAENEIKPKKRNLIERIFGYE